MDVVRTNVEKIGGNVEVKSFEGKGTSIQLRIPLTLAIVPALVVKSGQCKFAIPQVKLVELVRAESVGAIGSGVHMERLQGRPTCRLRGQLLPLYDIREITKEEFDSEYKDGTFIVVLSAEGSNFGLLVSEVLDTADIVVKPLSSLLNNLAIFSGATILGDGSIALILDVQGVAENGGVLSKKSEKEEREAFSKQEKAPVTTDVQEFLLFNAGSDTIHTLPLCLVSRLEEFLEEAIELSGDQRLVRYRGGLLPLINLSETLKYDSNIKSTGRVSVIVVQRSGRNYGFIVNEIVDVMTIEGQIDDSIRDRNGILGNLIHKDQVVVVIDALGIIEGFNASSSKQPTGAVSRDALNEIKSLNKEMKFKSVRVLYAEDVAFFRKHVSKLLAGAGIDITTVEDGKKALQELDASDADRYNLILSDIEMPNLNGLELAREIRKRERFKSIPIVALTTRFRDSDIAEGKAAGFNTYLEKLNPEKLLTAIQELMGTKPNEENLIKEVVQNG
jgi:two-component system chemotaxis sensor kinase CheA